MKSVWRDLWRMNVDDYKDVELSVNCGLRSIGDEIVGVENIITWRK